MATTLQLIINASTGQAKRELRGVKDDIQAIDQEARAAGKGGEAMAASMQAAGRRVSEAMRKSQADADQLTARLSSMAEASAQAGTRLALMGGAGAAAFALFGRSALSAAASMEQTRVSFTILLHSSDAAKKSLTELANFAKTTPFEFGQVTDASKKLLAYGVAADDLIPTLRTLGDAAGSLGLDAGGMDRLIVAFGQIGAKAKLELQDLRQLAEAGIPVFDILQKRLGLTAEQVQNIGQAGIDSRAGLAALTAGMNEAFGGGMERMSKTFNGIVSNLSDTWKLFLSNVEGTGLGDRIMQDAKPALDGLLSTMERLQRDGTLDRWAADIGGSMAKVTSSVTTAVELFGKYPEVALFGVKVAAVGTASALAAGSLLMMTSGTLKAVAAYKTASVAVAGFSAASGIALAPIAAGVAALGVGIGAMALAWKTNFLGIRDATDKFIGWFRQNIPGLSAVWKETADSLSLTWRTAMEAIQTAAETFAPRIRATLESMFPTASFIAERTGALMGFLGKTAFGDVKQYVEARTEAARLMDPNTWKKGAATATADTTRGRSPGAAKYSPGAAGTSERQEWKTEAAGFFDGIKDYLRTRGVDPAGLRLTNTSKGAHARYRAMDVGGPQDLYPMVIEAAHALGLKVSDESGPGKYSAKATGPHLHIFKPTEGQNAAYAAQERESEDRKRSADKDAEEARQAAREAAQAGQRAAAAKRQAEYALVQSGGMTPMLDRVLKATGAGERYEPQARELTTALMRADDDYRAGAAATKGNARGTQAVTDARLAQRQAAYEAFARAKDEARQKDLDAEQRAADESVRITEAAVDKQLTTSERLWNMQLREVQDRIRQHTAEGTLTQQDRDDLNYTLKGIIEVARKRQDYVAVLEKEKELKAALSDFDTRDMPASQKTATLEDLKALEAKLENQRDFTTSLGEEKRLTNDILAIRQQIADVEAGRPPLSLEAQKALDQIKQKADAVKQYEADRVNLAKQADEAIAQSWSHRVVGLAFGETKGFFKGLMDDLKNIFRRWLEETLAMQLLAKKRAGQYAPQAGGGGILGAILGSVLGGGGRNPAMSFAGGGIMPMPGRIPGLGGIGTPPTLLAALLGSTVGKSLFGSGGGTGGGIGGLIGMLTGGPVGGLLGSLTGGLLSGLFGGHKHKKAPGFYMPSISTPNLYALSPDSYKSAAPDNIVTNNVNATQNIYNTAPRPLDGLSKDLADRAARSLRTMT